MMEETARSHSAIIMDEMGNTVKARITHYQTASSRETEQTNFIEMQELARLIEACQSS